LYKLARKGIVKEFTGVSDPYETPQNAELVIDSSDVDPEKLVEKIYDFIKSSSFI
ncbi:MAG: adenylyl-sulfate kinase, partial [Candidatus Marinimicrobia bacterium]|nr:adenylyl-sulfate kinase [Candidatus Neomarinimicrobiota bacterium]